MDEPAAWHETYEDNEEHGGNEMDNFEEAFDNIIRVNFGQSPIDTDDFEPQEVNWLGFAAKWIAAYDIPAEDPTSYAPQETINVHLRELLPALIDWSVQCGVADELAEYLECDDWICGLAEILLLRVMQSHWDGLYCDGSVGQPSIAVMDWGRLSTAFVTAYEAHCDL